MRASVIFQNPTWRTQGISDFRFQISKGQRQKTLSHRVDVNNENYSDLTFDVNVLTLSLEDSAEAITWTGRLFQSLTVRGIKLLL